MKLVKELKEKNENLKVKLKEMSHKMENFEINVEKYQREINKNYLVIKGLKIDTDDERTFKLPWKILSNKD